MFIIEYIYLINNKNKNKIKDIKKINNYTKPKTPKKKCIMKKNNSKDNLIKYQLSWIL